MTMPYRMAGPEEIDTKKLLLWPNNPRLKISDFREVEYSDKELQHPANQRNIFKLLSKHEDHDVETLIEPGKKIACYFPASDMGTYQQSAIIHIPEVFLSVPVVSESLT